MSCKSLLVLCASFLVICWSQESNVDKPIYDKCGKHLFITGVLSHHDRRWQYLCSSLPNDAGTNECNWKSNANEDQPVTFRCPNNRVITGVKSDSRHGDRILGVRCCLRENRQTVKCQSKGFANDHDRSKFNFVPHGHAIVGLESERPNKQGVRRWKAKVCALEKW